MLGVAVDPDGEIPRIILINDDSPLKYKMKLGDMIIAVNDEDVSMLTPTNVSMMLGNKSSNVERKITILRELNNVEYDNKSVKEAVVPTPPTTTGTTAAIPPATFTSEDEDRRPTANYFTDSGDNGEAIATVGVSVMEIETTTLSWLLGMIIADYDESHDPTRDSPGNCDGPTPLSDMSACVVSRVRDDSSLKNIIYAGDRIVGVDGEDVSKWKRVHVSKMLGSKSMHAMRKIKILRNVPNEETGRSIRRSILDGRSSTNNLSSHPTSSRSGTTNAPRSSIRQSAITIDGADLNYSTSSRGTATAATDLPKGTARPPSLRGRSRSRSRSSDPLSVDASSQREVVQESVNNALIASPPKRVNTTQGIAGPSSFRRKRRPSSADPLSVKASSQLGVQVQEAVNSALKAHSDANTRFREWRTTGVYPEIMSLQGGNNDYKNHQKGSDSVFTPGTYDAGIAQCTSSVLSQAYDYLDELDELETEEKTRLRENHYVPMPLDLKGSNSSSSGSNRYDLKSCLKSSMRGSIDTSSRHQEEERLSRSNNVLFYPILDDDVVKASTSTVHPNGIVLANRYLPKPLSHPPSEIKPGRSSPSLSNHPDTRRSAPKSSRPSLSESNIAQLERLKSRPTYSQARTDYQSSCSQARESICNTSLQTHTSRENDPNVTTARNAVLNTTRNGMYSRPNDENTTMSEVSSLSRSSRGRSNTRRGRKSSESKSSSHRLVNSTREDESNAAAANINTNGTKKSTASSSNPRIDLGTNEQWKYLNTLLLKGLSPMKAESIQPTSLNKTSNGGVPMASRSFHDSLGLRKEGVGRESITGTWV